MKPWPGLVCVLLLLPLLLLGQTSAPRFDVKLAPEKQISHVLSRLTFGARPSDAAEVRKIGVEGWIDLQLNPERIPESPVLESRVEQLATMKLQTWEIFEKYPQPQRAAVRRVNPMASLPPVQQTKLRNGTVD